LGGLLGRLRQRLRSRPPADRSGERELVRTFQRRSYPGSRNRRYRLHLPAGFRSSGRYPLVMVLHGCRQTENDIRQVSGFDRVADEAGFIALYPFVTSYAGLRGRNCWGWWFDNEIHRGAGEVEDLWQIVEEVCRDYPVERRCIHVAGLSSGGGMAVAMMVSHARRIAAGAVVAGVPFGESAGAVKMMRVVRPWFRPIGEIRRAMQHAMGSEHRPVPIFIVHSDGDETLPLQAAVNIRESWRACFELPKGQPSHSSRGTTRGTSWEHCVYADAARKPIVETLFLSGPGHGWYGGRAGAYSYPDAPDISRLMWDFFRHHRLARRPHTRDTAV
jgi:poly(hydroxyalkanoate) depolymerase family esterase